MNKNNILLENDTSHQEIRKTRQKICYFYLRRYNHTFWLPQPFLSGSNPSIANFFRVVHIHLPKILYCIFYTLPSSFTLGHLFEDIHSKILCVVSTLSVRIMCYFQLDFYAFIFIMFMEHSNYSNYPASPYPVR